MGETAIAEFHNYERPFIHIINGTPYHYNGTAYNEVITYYNTGNNLTQLIEELKIKNEQQ
jgi:hypothetical protein